MRKSITKIVKATVAFAMAIGAGVGAAISSPKANRVVAATSSYSMTPNQATTGSEATTYITTITEFTHSGISWKMNLWNPSTLQIKTNQNSATSEFRFYNTSAFSGSIRNVIITFSALTVSDAAKLMFKGGTSEVNGTSGGSAGTWNSTNKTLTWAPGNSDNFTYFAFYQNGKAASGTNNLAESNAIVVTYEQNDSKKATSTTVSAANSKTSLDIAAVPTDTVQLSASVTYNDGANNVSDPAIVWSGNNDNVATTSASGLVTPVAKGNVRFTATYAGDATYLGSSNYIDITVYDSRETVITFADLAETYSWENGNAYTPVEFNGIVITATGGGNNAKYYTSNKSWRMYSGGSVVITPPSEKSITAVSSIPSRTFSIANDGSSATANITSNTEFTSITVTLGAKKVLDTISASITDNSRVWRVNDIVVASDLTIVPHYTDGSDGDEITDGTGVTVTNGTLTSAGENIVNVSYGGKPTTVTVNALSSTVVAWTITGSIGETVKSTAYNLEGLILHAWYDNGKTDEASSAVANLYELVASPSTAGATPDPDNEIDVKVYLKSDTGHANCLETFSNVAAPIINAPKGTIGNPYTVPEAREAIDDLPQNGTIAGAYVEGIICQVDSFNPTYKSITYWISADGTNNNPLQVYSGKDIDGDDFASVDDVEFGARVVVTGTLKKFNSTYEFDKNNELVSYDAPSAKDILDIYLRPSTSIKMIHGNESMTPGVSSDSIVFSTLGLSNGTKYSDPFDGGDFTITFDGGANDGKYYTTGSGIRTYGGGNFTISSTDKISKVELTWDGGNKPSSDDVVDVGAFDSSTSTWTGSEKNIVFTRPSGDGHWRLKSVTVYYWEFESVDSVALRLGASIPVSAWEAVNNDDNFEITDYGVMIFRTDGSHISSAPSVEDAYKANPANVAISRKNSNVPPAAENGTYSFVTKINITSTSNYDMYFCARAFVVINGTEYYFVGDEMQETVRSVANVNNGSNLSSGALAYLAGN